MKQLADGNIGQIEVRGPNVFRGYWKMPEKTREELRDDGFFITGDLGRIDELGYLQIVGRNKDLIISGGYNIYPKEIELVLDDLPGVLESAVIGAPHSDFGESVIGLLVAEDGQSLDLDTIEEMLSQSLARFKQPRKLFVIETLPRNTMGKVQKNILRDEFGSTFQDWLQIRIFKIFFPMNNRLWLASFLVNQFQQQTSCRNTSKSGSLIIIRCIAGNANSTQ